MSETIYFKEQGSANTQKTIDIAVAYARENGIRHIVVATTEGNTPRLLKGLSGIKVIAVTLAWGFRVKGENSVSGETRAELEAGGVTVHSAAHPLSGAEKALGDAFGGAYPVQIIADTLRFFGQGTKVAVEVATSALDAGLIPYGETIIAIGGSRSGADTAVTLVPSYSASIFETRIEKFLAKPLRATVKAK